MGNVIDCLGLIDKFGVIDQLFPYRGRKRIAFETYVKDISESNLSPDVKMILILQAKDYIKKLSNRETIVNYAFDWDEYNNRFRNKTINEDWLDNFLDFAGKISEKEVQIVWGKMLRNEYEKPGMHPPSVIRVLSELTKEIADAFSNIASMEVDLEVLGDDGKVIDADKKIIVPYDFEAKEWCDKNNVGFTILNEMEAIGLIKFNCTDSFAFIVAQKSEVVFRYYDDSFKTYANKDGIVLGGTVMLTRAGKCLKEIIKPKILDGYFKTLKDYYSRCNKPVN